MNTKDRIIAYYKSPESRAAYDVYFKGSQHMGYYPDCIANISEQEAQAHLHEQLADRLKPQKGQILLDAGSGQGVVACYLAKKYGCRVEGITIVPFEVEKAKLRSEKEKVQDLVNFQEMDYNQMSFPDNFFDAIYTTETLSHSPNINQTLKEFYRTLKPGGRVVFFEYTLASEEKFSKDEIRVRDIIINGSGMFGLKSFRHDEFPGLMTKAGFKQAAEENISFHMGPSMYRLRKLAELPYLFIRLLHLQSWFINTTAGVEMFDMAFKGLIRYSVFTGTKGTKP